MCLMSQVGKLSRAKYSSADIIGIVESLEELTGQDLFEGQAPHVVDEKKWVKPTERKCFHEYALALQE